MQYAYGAFELKRSYQKNFSLALAVAAAIHLLIIGGFFLYGYITSAGDKDVLVIKSLADLGPPPTITEIQKPQIPITQPIVTPPAVGTPKPIPDEQAQEEVTFATQKEMTDFNPNAKTSDSVVIDVDPGDYLPQEGDFVAVQEQPAIIKEVKPEYPEMARQAGVEGTVLIAALIDKEGKVREVRIAKESGANAGFEEAAKKAAWENVYKPAIQNNKPVAIWIYYPVNFKLR
ncbi:MAG TPA: energy transducer TonB [candidate division Zixibacteria bacterium]|nr:energy transducer TonB [candidate division Zixibacteria bacterium]